MLADLSLALALALPLPLSLPLSLSKFENFDPFWLYPPKKCVNPNNIITIAH